MRTWIIPIALSVTAHCGGEVSIAQVPTSPPSTAEPSVPTLPSSAQTAEPTASVEPSSPPKEERPKSSGGPLMIKSDPREITDTFGSAPGAKLEVGEDPEMAIFKIPENALRRAVNVTFKVEPKAKNNGALVGKNVYRLWMIVPPSNEASVVTSADVPFELRLATSGRSSVYLAIGEFGKDEKGKEKIIWQSVAPKTIDTGAGIAIFELPAVSDMLLHVTTKAP